MEEKVQMSNEDETKSYPYKAIIYFCDGSHLSVECDDFIAGDNGFYVAVRDGLNAATFPFSSVKYTRLVIN